MSRQQNSHGIYLPKRYTRRMIRTQVEQAGPHLAVPTENILAQFGCEFVWAQPGCVICLHSSWPCPVPRPFIPHQITLLIKRIKQSSRAGFTGLVVLCRFSVLVPVHCVSFLKMGTGGCSSLRAELSMETCSQFTSPMAPVPPRVQPFGWNRVSPYWGSAYDTIYCLPHSLPIWFLNSFSHLA